MKGLRERIAEAKSIDHIEKLLKEGEVYEFASTRLKKRWQTTAEKRKKELREGIDSNA